MKNAVRGGVIFKLTGQRAASDPVKYNSVSTRYSSLQSFLGGAEIKERNVGFSNMPFAQEEALERRFNSGANRTDLPSCWGPANIARHFGYLDADLSQEMAGWIRREGIPIYRKG